MRLLVTYIFKIFLFLFLLFLMVPIPTQGAVPSRMEMRIDLEWTLDELFANAPMKIRDNYSKNATLKTFVFYRFNPHITYQDKELPCNGATSAFLSYRYEVPISLSINGLDMRAKSVSEIEERLREWLPIIDSMGFKRKEGHEAYSEKNFPLPKTYRSEDTTGIGWESTDRMKLFKLLISVPPDPEHYRKEKKYFLSFAYYDDTDKEVLKKKWLEKLQYRNAYGNTDASKASFEDRIVALSM